MNKFMNINRVLFLMSLLTSTTFCASAQICFATQSSAKTVFSNSNQRCSADFNHDGKLDLAISNSNGTISICLTNGLGGFGSITQIMVGSFSQSICTGDFNADGNPDLATYNNGPGEASILLGTNSGNFVLQANPLVTNIFGAKASLCTADFDGDGKLDLMLSTGLNNARLALGNGNGTFGTFNAISLIAPITGQMISADFNNDGFLDFISLGSVVLSNGSGSFSNAFSFSYLKNLMSYTVGDFNSDGKLDVVTSNWGSGSLAGYQGNVSLYIGNGMGGFASPIDFSIGDSTVAINSNQSLQTICSGDFNKDGKLDIALGTIKTNVGATSNQVSILEGDGNGSFGLPIELPFPEQIYGISSMQLNSDTAIDLVLQSRNVSDTSHVTVLLNCISTSLPNELTELQSVQIFPNPCSGQVHVRSLYTIEQLKVIDVLGHIVYNEKPNQREVLVPLYASGIYVAQIFSNHSSRTIKIINSTN